MIQLTTQPLPGLAPAPRAAGFPLGTTSDFALALAELAGGAAGVVPPPGVTPASGLAIAAITPQRQDFAEGGTILPEATGVVTAFVGLSTEAPVAALPMPTLALRVLGQPIAPETDEGEGASDEGDAPGDMAPLATMTSLIDAAVPSSLQAIVPPPPIVVPPEATARAPIATKWRDPQAVETAAILPASKSVIPRPTVSDVATSSSLAPPVIPVEVRSDIVPVAGSPMIAPLAPVPMPVTATIQSVVTAPSLSTDPPVSNIAGPTIVTNPRPTAVATDPTIAAPPMPVPTGTPAKGQPDIPASTSTEASAAPAFAVPPVASSMAPAPVAAEQAAPMAVPPVAVESTPPKTNVSSARGTGAVAEGQPAVVAIVTPTVERRLDQAFAPIPSTVPSAPAPLPPVAPAVTATTTSVSIAGPTSSVAPVSIPASISVVASTVVDFAPSPPIGTKPVESTPVVVTVVPLPATPPPAHQLQPAAQAFAAAMFAASAAVEPVESTSDDLLPLTLATTAPTALQSPTIAVAAPTQGQSPTLDMAQDDWMAAMIDRIETLRDESGGVRETRMKLLPEALGAVEVSVRRDETGAIQVRIAADTAQARALLAEAAPKLAEMAEARGVKLGGSSVDAGAGDPRRDTPAQAPAPVARRPASARNDTTTDTASDTRLA